MTIIAQTLIRLILEGMFNLFMVGSSTSNIYEKESKFQ